MSSLDVYLKPCNKKILRLLFNCLEEMFDQSLSQLKLLDDAPAAGLTSMQCQPAKTFSFSPEFFKCQHSYSTTADGKNTSQKEINAM